MDMPVVAAARLKRHISNGQVSAEHRVQIALTDEILRICVIGLAQPEHAAVHLRLIFRPDLLGHIEGSPRLRPAGIKCRMRDDLCDLLTGDAVLLRAHQVVAERRIHQSLREQRHYGHQGTIPQRELVFSAPHFSK